MSLGRLAGIIVWWFWIPIVYFIISGLLALFAHGLGTTRQGLSLFVQEELLPGGAFDVSSYTPMAWIYVIIGLVGTAVIAVMDSDRTRTGSPATTFAACLLALVAIVPLCKAMWDNDKDDGRYYSSATTFYLPSKTPSSTAVLFKTATGDKATMTTQGGCQYGVHDVRVCIKVSDTPYLPDWEGRTASLSGALKATTKAGAPMQRVDVMEESATYLPGKDADTGVWTTILDGSERIQPAFGVAQWDGKEQTAKICPFREGYKFNRAFNGVGMNDLENYITEYYPYLLFDRSDVWGYCAGDAASVADRYPVIVIPVQQAVPFEVQALRAPAGVLILKGSKSGTPAIEWKPNVKAGELPGPVYPLSIVAAQRDAADWTAGRRYMDRSSFGFEPATDEVQAGNTSEFLLRDRKTKRLWFVTPASPNGSKSQSIIAYMLTPADQVTSGRLNPLDVHVYPDGDEKIVNFNEMVASAQTYLATTNPGLISSGLKLTEFTPLTEDRWRLFGEMRGVTVLYLDVSASRKTPPQAVSLDTSTMPQQPVAQPGKETAAAGCGADPAKMAPAALIDCAQRYLSEYQRRTATP